MLVTTAVRRRTQIEQRVLSILRGCDQPPHSSYEGIRQRRVGRTPAVSSECQACFDQFRERAVAEGMAIQAINAPYVSMDELRILNAISDCQRASRKAGSKSIPSALEDHAKECADILELIGLHLPFRP